MGWGKKKRLVDRRQQCATKTDQSRAVPSINPLACKVVCFDKLPACAFGECSQAFVSTLAVALALVPCSGPGLQWPLQHCATIEGMPKVGSGVGVVGARPVTPAPSEFKNFRILGFIFFLEFKDFKDLKVHFALFANPFPIYHVLQDLVPRMQIAYLTLGANPEPDGRHHVPLPATFEQKFLLQIVVDAIFSVAVHPAVVL